MKYHYKRKGRIIAEVPTKNGGWLVSIWNENPNTLPILAYTKTNPEKTEGIFALSMTEDGRTFLNGVSSFDDIDDDIY